MISRLIEYPFKDWKENRDLYAGSLSMCFLEKARLKIGAPRLPNGDVHREGQSRGLVGLYKSHKKGI